jgi:hypothetical protein
MRRVVEEEESTKMYERKKKNFMRVNRQSFFGRKLKKTTKTQTRDDDKTMSRQI